MKVYPDGFIVMSASRTAVGMMAFVFATALTGCGIKGDRPELGEVTGQVTYRGAPLANASVAFRPAEGGRVAQGETDESGRYRLLYIRFPQEVWGAKVGEQTVIVTTLLTEHDPGGPQPERIPKCYRGKDSILRAVVREGKNEIDFDLRDDCSS